MKNIATVFFLLLIITCGHAKEKVFTGSTPSGKVVKLFLGIPLGDSVDFIRWKVIIRASDYQISCNYGIGKNNSNGFINGGSVIELKGKLTKSKNHYQLQNGNRSLHIAELNENLIHIMDDNYSLLVGNGGWSYTLNSINPSFTSQQYFVASITHFKDSISFQGRTPCKIPGLLAPGTECYKLKWHIILYTGGKDQPGEFKIFGTPWRKAGAKTGHWTAKQKNGKNIYQLNDENGKTFLFLQPIDENLVVITDAKGNLLVGDEDFSYTLNRR